MPEPLLFVGTYNIPREGVDAFYSQVEAMNRVVRDHEPRIVFIGHYVNHDQTEGTSIHLHPDADSFDFHMATASKAISTGAETVSVKRIEFYGRPSDAVLTQLSAAYDVQVKDFADGFDRIDWP